MKNAITMIILRALSLMLLGLAYIMIGRSLRTWYR